MNILSMIIASLASSGGAHATPVPTAYVPPPQLLRAIAQREGEDTRSRELSVLTYNVRGLPWPAARGRRAALRAIGAELGRLRSEGRAPDIVLIQEGFEDLSELARLSGYRHWVSGPKRGDRRPVARDDFAPARWPFSGEGWGKFTGSGLYVLSDLPLVGVRSAPFPRCAGFDCLANKGVMLVTVQVEGLPASVEVLNTHMNSRSAAKVPWSRSLHAHNLQSDALFRFLGEAHEPGAPLLVGGDFNVKAAAARYYYRADDRPFVVVSEFCKAKPAGCGAARPPVGDEPWLAGQDLQAFSTEGAMKIRPIGVEALFAGGETGPRLSDHDGLLVRYRLSWSDAPPAAQAIADLR